MSRISFASGLIFRAAIFVSALVGLPSGILSGSAIASDQDSSDQNAAGQKTGDAAAVVEFFERKIRPVLVEQCYECHSGESDVLQGGLRLDSSREMLRGGDSGSAIAPGDPEASLLVAALRYDGMEMPPDQPLGENVIRDFEQWIRLGATMPQPTIDPSMILPSEGHAGGAAPEVDWQSERQFWAYQAPERHDPSEITLDPKASAPMDLTWRETELDGFVQARLAAGGLQPNGPATKETWIRRVTFDLIGLLPSMEQV